MAFKIGDLAKFKADAYAGNEGSLPFDSEDGNTLFIKVCNIQNALVEILSFTTDLHSHGDVQLVTERATRQISMHRLEPI